MNPKAILIETHPNTPRRRHHLSCGVPLRIGELREGTPLTLFDQDSSRVSHQFETLRRWPDGSIQWARVDFGVVTGEGRQTTFQLRSLDEGSGKVDERNEEPSLGVTQTDRSFCLDTGSTRFCLSRESFPPDISVLDTATERSVDANAKMSLFSKSKEAFEVMSFDSNVVRSGPVLAEIEYTARLQNPSRTQSLLVQMLFRFSAGDTGARCQVRIHNPAAAHHAGNCWDLGDDGSVFLDKFLWEFSADASVFSESGLWDEVVRGDLRDVSGTEVTVYQEASGGRNCFSVNHVDGRNVVPFTLRGYTVLDQKGNEERSGERAQPSVFISDGTVALTVSMIDFWQNFPSSLLVGPGRIHVGFFPQEFPGDIELQGGEAKTHEVYVGFGKDGRAGVVSRCFPARARVTREQYADSNSVPHLTEERPKELSTWIDTLVSGSETWESRNERIDEYGWRNFGDVFADHEAVRTSSPDSFVSHYNNQYDLIQTLYWQYLSSGDPAWREIASRLAAHVADIDIYHTDFDRPAYNHGLFWHTDHHVPAATCTHRTFSRRNKDVKGSSYGGGPSIHHLYPSGLFLAWLIEGDERFRSAAEELCTYAETKWRDYWAITSRAKRSAKSLISGVKAIASKSLMPLVVYDLTGPGRGSGNTLNTFLDAYLHTCDRKYLELAERLIRSCVRPDDDIGARKLLEIEVRWMYVIFLQALAKYLHVKKSVGENDKMFHYGLRSLLHYADWMVEHEYPYLRTPEKLEFPNETKAAQELRKVYVLLCAHEFSGSENPNYLRKAAELYRESISDLGSFGKAVTFIRPLAIIGANSLMLARHMREIGGNGCT